MYKPQIINTDDYVLIDKSEYNYAALFDRCVASAVPISASIIKANDIDLDNQIVRVTWLCKCIDDKLFCLSTTYVLENDHDADFIAMLPFTDSRYFVNYKLTSDLLMSSLPSYLTDMNFQFTSIGGFIFCYAVDMTCNKDERLKTIQVNADTFASLMFIDNYMVDGIINNGDLHSALMTGANDKSDVRIFNVNRLGKIDLALVKHKKENHIVANMILFSDIEEQIKLVSIFNIGRTKVKNKEIKKANFEDFIKKADKYTYIHRFMFYYNEKEDNKVEESYTYVKAENSNGNNLLVSFGKDVRAILSDYIASSIC